jgi:hypothetical protein
MRGGIRGDRPPVLVAVAQPEQSAEHDQQNKGHAPGRRNQQAEHRERDVICQPHPGDRRHDGGECGADQQGEREDQEQPTRGSGPLLPREQAESEDRQEVLERTQGMEHAAVEIAEATAQAVRVRRLAPGEPGGRAAAGQQPGEPAAQGENPIGAACSGAARPQAPTRKNRPTQAIRPPPTRTARKPAGQRARSPRAMPERWSSPVAITNPTP